MKKMKWIIALVVLALLVPAGIVGWMATPGLRPPMQVPEPNYWPTAGWKTATPEEHGYSSARLAKALQDIQERGTGIDSLLIIHNGYMLLDAHFSPYDGSFQHNLASVTKSVITTLIEIAADQGKIDLDRTMISYFPNRTIANLDERKARITVRHLMTMTTGMKSGCYADDEGALNVIRSVKDWVQGALDRPMVAEPGTTFCYDSPTMHILSAILQDTAGMTALQFATQYLFEPLGIQDAIWDVDPQGYNRGWGDLYLTPESAAKIGYLWLHQGNWDGKQIVSQNMVLDMVRRYSTKVNHDAGYGYGMWINQSFYFAAGRGGQNIIVIPAKNTVLVTTGGLFDMPEIEGDITLPVLLSGRSRKADPEGLALLQSTLKTIEMNPIRPAVYTTPAMAKTVSGKLYRCAGNPAGLESLSADFSDPAVVNVSLKLNGEDVFWKIGLDGRYRLSADGDGFIGYWENDNTFHLELFDIGTQNFFLKFTGDAMQLTQPDAGLAIACQAETP